MTTRLMRDFALEVYFSKWEFAAKYNMAGSDGENMTLAELLALASAEDRAAFESVNLGYTETFGAPALRAEIAQTYDTVRPEHLLCFAGAEEGIYVAMKVLLNSGDHAIVITPNYQAAETVPLGICEVSGVPLDIDRDWDLDVDLLRAALRPNTKLISINFPNNPTGKIIPRAAFDAMVVDPAFLAEAAQLRLLVTPMAAAEVVHRVGELYATPAEVLTRAKAVAAE